MGVSDFRDFAVLVPADRDPGAKDTLEADELVDVGRAASGTTHPATMAIVPVWEESARDLVSIDDGLGALVGTVAGRRAAFVVAGTASVEGY